MAKASRSGKDAELEGLSLHTRLILCVMAAMLPFMIFLVVMVAVTLSTQFPEWIKATEEYMIDAESEHLGRVAVEQSAFADLYLQRVRNGLTGLCDFAEGLMDGTIDRNANIPLYSSTEDNPTANVPRWSDGTERSNEVTAWYVCEPGTGNPSASCGVQDSVPPRAEEKLRRVAPAVLAFRSMLVGQLPEGRGGFWSVSFEEDGAMAVFPYLQLAGFRDWEGPCSPIGIFPPAEQREGYSGPEAKRGYDPRCRPWYSQAKEANGRVQFTDPYFFAGARSEAPELGVTASVSMRGPRSLLDGTFVDGGIDGGYNRSDPSSMPGNSFVAFEETAQTAGVCMVDFSMNEIDVRARQRKLSEGYGFIFVASTGNAVVHPALDWAQETEARSVAGFEFPGEDPSGAGYTGFEEAVLEPARQFRNEEGQARYTKGGKQWLAAWGPLPSSGYVLAVTVPEEDVREPFETARDAINFQVLLQVIISAVAVLVTGLISAYLGSVVAAQVVEPVLQLNAVVDNINNAKFDGELPPFDPTTSEMQHLESVFRGFYSLLQFANARVFEGDAEQAEMVFRRALSTFDQIGNERGKGLCLNNLGGVLLQKGRAHYDEAVGLFRHAVEQAQSATHRFYQAQDAAKQAEKEAREREWMEQQANLNGMGAGLPSQTMSSNGGGLPPRIGREETEEVGFGMPGTRAAPIAPGQSLAGVAAAQGKALPTGQQELAADERGGMSDIEQGSGMGGDFQGFQGDSPAAHSTMELARQEARRRANLAMALQARALMDRADLVEAAEQLLLAGGIVQWLAQHHVPLPTPEEQKRLPAGITAPMAQQGVFLALKRWQLGLACSRVAALAQHLWYQEDMPPHARSRSMRAGQEMIFTMRHGHPPEPGAPLPMLSVELVKDAAEMARSLWREFHHYTEHASPQVARELFGRPPVHHLRRLVEGGSGGGKTGGFGRVAGASDTSDDTSGGRGDYDDTSVSESEGAGAGAGTGGGSGARAGQERFIPGVVPELKDATQMRVVIMEAWLAAVEGRLAVTLQLLRQSFLEPEHIDPGVSREGLKLMGAVLERCGVQGGKDLCSGSGPQPRDVALVIDRSGSMAGGRMRRVKAALETLVGEHVSDGDHVAVVGFNEKVHVSMPYRHLGSSKAQVQAAIEEVCKPGGGTAMYDALAQVLRGLEGEDRTRMNYVVCLTDGEDSNSKQTAAQVRRMLAQRTSTTLIIVSVGRLETEASIRSLCEASKGGALVTAENNEAIARAFKTVSELINKPQTTFEAY